MFGEMKLRAVSLFKMAHNNDVNTTKLLVNQLKDNANNHYKMNHQTIPSDDSCLSPDHNAHNCKRCKEAVKYENATYCPECCCHYIDGKEVPAPEFTDVIDDMCEECRAIESEELLNENN